MTFVKTPVKIRIDASTRDDLRALKKGGDTFDDVVRRLISVYRGSESDEPGDLKVYLNGLLLS
ncbi:unnamed protein product, partial [marine sediment metagenome]